MKNNIFYIILIVSICAFFTNINAQVYQDFWFESFSCEANGATVAGPICGFDSSTPAPPGSWQMLGSMDVTNLGGGNGYGQTNGTSIGQFLSSPIGISGFSQVKVIVDVFDNLTSSGAYIDICYRLDGATTFQCIPNWQGMGNASHTLVSPNFGDETVFIDGIVGNSIEILVQAECVNCSISDQYLGIYSVQLEEFVCAHPDYSNLMSLYNNTDGDNWTNNTGWGSDCLPCTWFGVNCQNIMGVDRVTEILLPNNNLNGIIPSSLGGMVLLDSLNLSTNSLTDTIPKSLGNLSNLQSLRLDNNNLIGCFDALLSNLCTISIIEIDCNGTCNMFGATWSDFCLDPINYVCCQPVGTPCDDGDPTTENDVEDGMCNCTGTPCPISGTACDDNDPTTFNDEEDGML